MADSQMKIHVNTDGVVEFSVSLNGTVDPTVVATMVAAVRAGVVRSPSTPSTLPYHHTRASFSRRPTSDLSRSPDSPRLNPTPSARRFSANHEGPPSPLVYAPIQKLSVRQLAAELESQHEADRLPAPTPFTDYDPIREFSSSPALWLSNKRSPYVDNLEVEHVSPTPQSPLSSTHSSHVRHLSARRSSPTARRPPPPPDRRSGVIYPEKSHHPLAGTTPDAHRPLSHRPVRTLSLPSGSRFEHFNDLFFGDDLSSQDLSAAQFGTRKTKSTSQAPLQDDDVSPASSIPVLSPKRRAGRGSLCNGSRSPDRRDRSHSPTPDPYIPPHDLTDDGSKRETSGLEAPIIMHRAASQSPLILDPGHAEQDPEDAWDNVEYVLTEEYRDKPKHPGLDVRERTGRAGTASRSAAWRLFHSIGANFSRKKADLTEDVHQSTLASGNKHSTYHREEKSAEPQIRSQPRRNRGGHLFGRNTVNSAGLWLEFSSPLSIERMLAEIGKISKTMGYQVWRRPGENKLRCIRQLSHRHEMHMVILVGSVRLPEGPITVVRLRRARGDRNRTEWWRYSHYYREVVERLQRSGVEISAEV